MTIQEITILGTAMARAVDETLAEFINDEQLRGQMRGAIIKKLNENIAMLINTKKND